MKTNRAAARSGPIGFLLACALTCGTARAAAPAPPPSDTLWRYTAPAKIQGTQLDAVGNLVLAMDTLVVALQPDSGTVAWRCRVGGKPAVFRTILGAYFLVGHGGTLTAIDPVTGRTVWQRTDMPDLGRTSLMTSRVDPYALAQSGDRFAVLDMRTGATRWDSKSLPPGTVVREYFRLSEQNLLLMLARTPAGDASMFAATLDSGRVLWRDDSFFRAKPKIKSERGVEYLASGYQYSVLFPDSTLLLYLSEDGPMRIDPRTGSVRWRGAALEGASVPGWQDYYPTARLLDSLVLLPSEKRVVALDATTGSVRWRTARDFRDRPTWLAAGPAGILVAGLGRTKSFLTVLDPRTGAGKGPKPIELEPTAVGLLQRDTVYVSNDGRFSAIPLATGIAEERSTIGFQGGEQPASLDTLESGAFVLFSRQNIARIEADGRVVYRRFYKAPGASFWAKLASSALILGANVASYALAPAGGVAPMIMSNPALSARYGRASKAQDVYYMFTASPDSLDQEGFSLVRVDRRDGRELGRMWFEERSPDYRLDPVTGSVYVLKDDRHVVARRFE